MTTSFCFALVVSLFAVESLRADLKRALAEPNLEKRSGLALQNAVAAYQSRPYGL